MEKEQKIILASPLKILSNKIAGMLHKQMTEYISLTAQLSPWLLNTGFLHPGEVELLIRLM